MAKRANPAPAKAFIDGQRLVGRHPIFGPLARRVSLHRSEFDNPCPADGWAVAGYDDRIDLHPRRLAEPGHWAFVIGHCLLYYAMELFQRDRASWPQWSAACDVSIVRFLGALQLGAAPEHLMLPDGLPGWDEVRWYQEFCRNGIPAWAADLSPAGPRTAGMAEPSTWGEVDSPCRRQWKASWPEVFAAGIAQSVSQAVEVAAGAREALGATATGLRSAGERARGWFIGSFPLLGAMVSAFEFIEEAEIARREEISVAAVDELARTIYINPAAALTEYEARFVIAHEILHVALRHLDRRQGRDPLLWNVACDFVVNDWLIEMRVGVPPALGLLHDPALHGLSAEEVYDRLALDMRRLRKLLTFAGRQGDMLERRIGRPQRPFTDLDAFYREQLAKGLALHEQQGRGLLPAGLVEEIRALLQPPIGWDVQLARWFDHHFPPIERVRSYARASRRQSSTPEIPRPRWMIDSRWLDARTFGVVLDTSGSMERQLLAKALGAIASYAEAKEVPAVRVIFCDAAAHDAGYMPAESMAGRVAVTGRGGTVLQPGIDRLESAADFPKDGPILVITDGACDVLQIAREHAFLLPQGRRLPFRPRGEVFYLS